MERNKNNLNLNQSMEVKGLVTKKNYTMTKNKSAVKNKANNDKIAVLNERKGQVKSVKVGEIIEFSSERGQKTTYGMRCV